jgi:hypothetical protein
VGLEAVELDDEALIRPSEVGVLRGVDGLVDEGTGQAFGIEKGEEPPLDLAAGGGLDDAALLEKAFDVRNAGASRVARDEVGEGGGLASRSASARSATRARLCSSRRAARSRRVRAAVVTAMPRWVVTSSAASGTRCIARPGRPRRFVGVTISTSRRAVSRTPQSAAAER